MGGPPPPRRRVGTCQRLQRCSDEAQEIHDWFPNSASFPVVAPPAIICVISRLLSRSRLTDDASPRGLIEPSERSIERRPSKLDVCLGGTRGVLVQRDTFRAVIWDSDHMSVRAALGIWAASRARGLSRSP